MTILLVQVRLSSSKLVLAEFQSLEPGFDFVVVYLCIGIIREHFLARIYCWTKCRLCLHSWGMILIENSAPIALQYFVLHPHTFNRHHYEVQLVKYFRKAC